MSDNKEPDDGLEPLESYDQPSGIRLREQMPIRFLVPNMLTILALSAGLTALRFAVQGRFALAASLILIAALLDGLDGRVARYMKGVSKLGAEMDSLADIVNFGVAPALMLYFWGLQDMRSLGWLAVLTYVVCCLLRLARFNVMSRETGDDASDPNFFVGVPAPAGAGLVLLPLFLYLAGFEIIAELDLVVAAYIAGVGLMMVSRIPTFSFKKILVPRDQIVLVLIGSALLVAFVLTYPWISMVLIDFAYVGSILFSIRAKRKSLK